MSPWTGPEPDRTGGSVPPPAGDPVYDPPGPNRQGRVGCLVLAWMALLPFLLAASLGFCTALTEPTERVPTPPGTVSTPPGPDDEREWIPV